MKDIEDNSVDMILADLPYGTTACSWDIVISFEPLWVQYKRVIKKKGAIVLFGSFPFSDLLVASMIDWFKYKWYWEKNIPTGIGTVKYQPMRCIEEILVFYKNFRIYNKINAKSKITDRNLGKHNGVFNEKKPSSSTNVSSKQLKRINNPDNILIVDVNPVNLLKFNVVNHSLGTLHPTQKPIALLEYLIKTYTQEGDLVLDNCMGSGSTGIACLNTKRDFIGIELYPLPNQLVSKKNPDYFGIAKNRIAKWQFEPSEDSKEEQINLF